MSKNNKMTTAANAFGSGKDLVGKTCHNKTIVSATRKTMTLENGKIVDRKGAHVTFEVKGPIINTTDTSAWRDY